MKDQLYPARPRVDLEATGNRLQVTLDYRGSQPIPERPLLMNCDFCGAEVDRLWGWPCRPHCVVAERFRLTSPSDGAWWACVFCNPLVRDRDLEALIARVCCRQPDLPLPMVRVVYPVVFAVIDGEPVTWAAGELWRKL